MREGQNSQLAISDSNAQYSASNGRPCISRRLSVLAHTSAAVRPTAAAGDSRWNIPCKGDCAQRSQPSTAAKDKTTCAMKRTLTTVRIVTCVFVSFCIRSADFVITAEPTIASAGEHPYNSVVSAAPHVTLEAKESAERAGQQRHDDRRGAPAIDGRTDSNGDLRQDDAHDPVLASPLGSTKVRQSSPCRSRPMRFCNSP